MVSVFKTNIYRPDDVLEVLADLNKRVEISVGTIDTEDEDHILRVEYYRFLSINEVTETVKNRGFYCEELTH